jgi:hypothetical protein
MSQDLLFEVATPMGFSVRCTRAYWQLIVTYKHPTLAGREIEVALVLRDPDLIRRSRRDPGVLLFYRGFSPRWLCAVARRLNGDGFLITAYPTDSIKVGEPVWTRSK